MGAELEARELGWLPIAEARAIDEEQLRGWLEPWPELQDQRWQRLGGGLRSINLRFGEVVARIGGGEHSVGKERALLERVEGVRVPAVRGGSDHLVLLEYVPHDWLPATGEAGERVGAAAAAIHGWRFDRAGFLDDSLAVARPFDSILGGLRAWAEPMLVGRAGQKLGSLVAAVRAAWAAEEEAMAAASPVLVHADFKPMNIGWLPAVRDVVVFDWEFAWAGPALFDLGQLLRWNPPAAFIDGVERGYRAAGGHLPAGWKRLAELFDLFNLIGFLDHPRACDRRIADTLERIRQTVA